MDEEKNMVDFALEYIANGLYVLPVKWDKKPHVNWGEEIPMEEGVIREMWRQWPNANIGIDCGRSNIVVIDADGEEGVRNARRLFIENDVDVEACIISRTGGGGLHYYFAAPSTVEIRNSARRIAPGVDVRGSGGYIIAPPSLHQSGNRYEWIKEPNGPLPELSPALVRLLTERRPSKIGEERGVIPDGRRNETLFSIGCSLRRRGFEYEGILTRLLEENENRCQPPVSTKEVEGRAQSASRYPATSRPAFPWTDLGNAEKMQKRFGEDIYHCTKWKRWLVWDGKIWDDEGKVRVKQMYNEVAKGLWDETFNYGDLENQKKATSWARTSESASKEKACLTKLEALVPITPDDLDRGGYLFNLQNGTMNLERGIEFREHSRGDLITKISPVVYDPEATCPRFEQFLGEILDPQVIPFIQRAAGLSLTGDVSEQKLFILYGTGNNGKSTLLETLRYVLGDYASQANFNTFLKKKYDGIGNDLARLKGARFITAVEAPEGRGLDTTVLKQWTGIDKVTARFLYAEPFEFVPEGKLWLAVNHKPDVGETGEAIWRRILLVKFNRTIPYDRRDKKMAEKLKEEAPGILNWALRGWEQVLDQGLNPPSEVLASTSEYREEEDEVKQFLLDIGVEEEEGGLVHCNELYKNYVEECNKVKSKPLTRNSFGRRMTELGYERTKKGGGWCYVGLALP